MAAAVPPQRAGSHHGGAARGPRSPPGRLRRTLRRSRRRRTEVGVGGGGGSGGGSRGSSSRALPSAAHAHCAQAALAGPALPADLERPRLPGWALFREDLVRPRPSARRRTGVALSLSAGREGRTAGLGRPFPPPAATRLWLGPHLRNASWLFERKTPAAAAAAGRQAGKRCLHRGF